MTDWEELRDRYIRTRLSAGELAEEFGVSRNALNYIIRKEGWAEQRRRTQSGDTEFRIERLADRLLRRLEKAVDENSEMDCKDIKAVTAALKELRELRGELGQSTDGGERTLEVSFVGETEEMSR